MNKNVFNPYITVETWRRVAKQFKRAPSWFWTKVKKAPNVTKKKGKKFVPNEKTVKFYLLKNEISTVQFNDAMKLNSELMLSYLQRIEKSMETIND